MKDIIYREDAVKHFVALRELDKIVNSHYDGKITFDEVIHRLGSLNSLPSAERTETIRCKDCKRYDGRPCGLVNFYNTDDDYCSRYEGRDAVTQIAELFHEAIENTVIAEDEYPHLREKLHRAIDAECERLRGK